GVISPVSRTRRKNMSTQTISKEINLSQIKTAADQLNSTENILHSLNSGFVIHRVGQVSYDFLSEARTFAQELQGYMNMQLKEKATTLVYEEVLGNYGYMHWLVHMKTPSDYGQLLEMVDHDEAFQKIYQDDRLPQRGGGNWERMFVQGSFKENILVPQHGFAKEALDEKEQGLFTTAARHQLPNSAKPFLDTSSAGAILLRTGQAKYECRDLARYYLSEWQAYINKVAPGIITSSQFEEMWGSQDTLHMIVHLRSLADYTILRNLEIEDAGLIELMKKPRAEMNGEVVPWGGLFEASTLSDKVLLPISAQPHEG
ncbi:MAG: DUF6039 family protein, partial [Pseudomonadota bacterium]